MGSAKGIFLTKGQKEELLHSSHETSEGQEIVLKDELQKRVIILNFIAGSWCPMCMKQVEALLQFGMEKLKTDAVDIYIISTESLPKLKREHQRAKDNLTADRLKNVHFISDHSRKLTNLFNIRIPLFGFAKPATYLIMKDEKVIQLSKGIPNENKIVSDLSDYLLQEKAA